MCHEFVLLILLCYDKTLDDIFFTVMIKQGTKLIYVLIFMFTQTLSELLDPSQRCCWGNHGYIGVHLLNHGAV